MTKRNIVICCDGTANQFCKNNTNVVKIYEMIIADDQQLNFYDPGVGTSSGKITYALRKIENSVSQALGLDLSRNVADAYEFLMNNYKDGDQIFLFGFSRGAHTVRRLADVIGKYGLLWRGSDNMIPYVLRMYDADEDQNLINEFRDTYTYECPIHFLGIWDTVSALSRLIPRSKLDGILGPNIRNAYHAVSIDEVRFQFPPNLFNKFLPSQKVEEVWFAGVHSDVGGYYDERGLSNIALKWIFTKAVAHGLREIPESVDSIQENHLDKQHQSWSGLFWFTPWHMFGLLLFISILFVQLGMAFFDLFYDLPFRPFNNVVAIIKEYWYPFVALALAGIPLTRKIRKIPEGAKIHRSVEKRITDGKYKPKNLLHLIEQGKVNFVD